MVGSVIKSLVLQGKRVIIPDFGAFLIKDSTLNPVLTKDNVTFSPFLRYNDGFLESEIAHANALHKDEAAAKVREYVELVKRSVYEDEAAFHINGLGYFYKDGKGGILFSITPPAGNPKVNVAATPKPAEDYAEIPNVSAQAETTQAVAESANQEIAVPEEKQEEPLEVKVESKKESTPIASSITINVHEKLSAKDAEEVEKHEEEETVVTVGSSNNIPPSKRFSKGILVTFLLLLIGLFTLNIFWGDIFGSNGDLTKPKIILDPLDQEEMAKEKAKIEAKDVVQDAISDEVVTTVEKRVKEATSKKEEKKAEEKSQTAEKKEVKKEVKAETPKVAEKSGGIYELVLGSFGSEENARKHVSDLAKRNVKATISSKQKMFKVTSGSFKSYEEAQAEQNRVKALGFDGWISRK